MIVIDKKHGANIDKIIDGLMSKYNKKPIETDEEIVIRMLRGDFEKTVGISFGRFFELYRNIVENKPEKLI
jgi:hypothetical protein